MRILAVIGARSGSKGIPHKNIKPLSGVPLLARLIQKTKKSKHVNRVIVSTDSEEYAKLAREYGAEVPFLRTQDISGDTATDFEYVNQVYTELKKREGYAADIVLRLLCTVPFQITADIDGVIDAVMHDETADSGVVVAEGHQHPRKALKIIQDNGHSRLASYMTGLKEGVEPLPRQGYEKPYFRANIIASRSRALEKGTLTGDSAVPYVIPMGRSLDIDTPTDFLIADKLYPYFNEETGEFRINNG